MIAFSENAHGTVNSFALLISRFSFRFYGMHLIGSGTPLQTIILSRLSETVDEQIFWRIMRFGVPCAAFLFLQAGVHDVVRGSAPQE